MSVDINKIRSQFTILSREINGKPLVYLDNAATTQKPQSVLDAIEYYYTTLNSNVHRGVHTLSQLATEAMEDSRKSVQAFINAKKDYEVLFTKGTTESINLVANSIEDWINEGDEIIVSHLEHHANIVPWQMLCEKKKAVLKVIPVDDNGDLIMEAFDKLLSEKTKIVAVAYISNVLGVVTPIKEIIKKAHSVGAYVLIDGAQAISHKKIDVQELDIDFLAFSGHKMYGPTGVGVLYAKEDLLDKMKPYQGGGEMIKEVTFEKTLYADLPFKFEAGTPNIAGNIALKPAIEFMQEIGLENIEKYENEILLYATDKLVGIDNLIIYSKDAKDRAGAISFNFDIEGVHPSDVGFILDKQGIAIRTGHHCAQPIMSRFGVKGTARASFAVYTSKEDIDKLVESLSVCSTMLK